MAGNIYLLKDSNQLVEMKEHTYDSEDLLQTLLAQYPNLLAGDQINSSIPRRWLLVKREKEVPSQEGEGGRWAVDHLFLDQDGVPTLVEVKRSSDTRIRREVVGQMLDYAANATAYWSIEKIRAQFETNCSTQGLDPNNVLQTFLEEQTDHDQFWQNSKTNLQAGKIRLIFVADEIPNELRRIVEFLNAQMDPAEILAVEIKQFVGQGMKTLVPRVFGQTAMAERKKGGPDGDSKQWDEVSFFQELESKRGSEEANIARKFLTWGREHMSRTWWGRGKQTGSCVPVLDANNNWYSVIYLFTNGTLQVTFGQFGVRVPFNDENKRAELIRRFNAIPGISFPENPKYPGLDLSTFKNNIVMGQFLDVLNWAVDQIKETERIDNL
jgi:hypothetical protein